MNVKATFFFTGDFYRTREFQKSIRRIYKNGYYLGIHSDKHLLYNDWKNRDSLLVTKSQLKKDIEDNLDVLKRFDKKGDQNSFFLPPYEWYNDSISVWAAEKGMQLINFTPGTLSHADYTTPEMNNYKSSDTIWESIANFEKKLPSGLNGFILLMHIGVDPARKDKFYHQLPQLIGYLQEKGYQLQRIDELLKAD